MKSMRPPLAAIFFMTYFCMAGGLYIFRRKLCFYVFSDSRWISMHFQTVRFNRVSVYFQTCPSMNKHRLMMTLRRLNPWRPGWRSSAQLSPTGWVWWYYRGQCLTNIGSNLRGHSWQTGGRSIVNLTKFCCKTALNWKKLDHFPITCR